MFEFDTSEYAKAEKALVVLNELETKIQRGGVSRQDVQYGLEAAEDFFKLPARTVVQSFTAESSITNRAIALEAVSQGKKIGVSIMVGVIIALLTKIIAYFFSDGPSSSSGGTGSGSPYQKKMDSAMKLIADLREKEEKGVADLHAALERAQRLDLLKDVLRKQEPETFMRENPYTRVGFEILCSNHSRYLTVAANLTSSRSNENLINIYYNYVEMINATIGIFANELDKMFKFFNSPSPITEIPLGMVNCLDQTNVIMERLIQSLEKNKLIGPNGVIDQEEMEKGDLQVSLMNPALRKLAKFNMIIGGLGASFSNIQLRKWDEPADFVVKLTVDTPSLLKDILTSDLVKAWEGQETQQHLDSRVVESLGEHIKYIKERIDSPEWEKYLADPDLQGPARNVKHFVDSFYAALSVSVKQSGFLPLWSNQILSGIKEALGISKEFFVQVEKADKQKIIDNN